jgi:hypothetical protein
MEEFLADIPTLDINLPDIVTRYVDKLQWGKTIYGLPQQRHSMDTVS